MPKNASTALLMVAALAALFSTGLCAQRAWSPLGHEPTIGVAFFSRSTTWEITQTEVNGNTMEGTGETFDADKSGMAIMLGALTETPTYLRRWRYDFALGFNTTSITVPANGQPDTEFDGEGGELGLNLSIDLGKEIGETQEAGGMVGLGFGAMIATFDTSETSPWDRATLVEFAFPLVIGGYWQVSDDALSLRTEFGIDIGVYAGAAALGDDQEVLPGVQYELETESAASAFINVGFAYEIFSAGLMLEGGRITRVRLFFGLTF